MNAVRSITLAPLFPPAPFVLLVPAPHPFALSAAKSKGIHAQPLRAA